MSVYREQAVPTPARSTPWVLQIGDYLRIVEIVNSDAHECKYIVEHADTDALGEKRWIETEKVYGAGALYEVLKYLQGAP